MARYVIRLELNGRAVADVYSKLHEVMSGLGAARTIRGDDGVVYNLPHATYVADSPADPEAVRDFVWGRTASVWNDRDIIVFRYEDAAWRLSPK